MSGRTVGVLHPGSMGATVAAAVRDTGNRVLWCPEGRSAATVQRAHDAGFTAVGSLSELAGTCDTVLSICPPAAAESVAEAVAQAGFTGIYIEANAINPQRLERIARILGSRSATVVDAAVMTSPSANGGRDIRIYLANDEQRQGTAATTVRDLFDHPPVTGIVLNGPFGVASALKLAHAQYQKAARVLAAVSYALAERFGVTEQLHHEAHLNQESPLAHPEFLPIVASRAWRWAPELTEVTEFLRSQGLPHEQARQASAVLNRWSSHKDHRPTLQDLLNDLSHDSR